MIKYEQELFSGTLTSFQSLKSNVITLMCTKPNLVFFLALTNVKALNDLVRTYQVSAFTPVQGREAEWVQAVEPIYQELSYIYNVILNAENNVSFLTSTSEFDYLANTQSAVNISDRLYLLGGGDSVKLNIKPAKDMNVELLSGPYDFNDDTFVVSGKVVTVQNTAIIESLRKLSDPTDIPLVVRCYKNGGGFDDVEIDTSSSQSFENFYFAVMPTKYTLYLTRGGTYFGFKVISNATSRAIGINSLNSPNTSLLATSSEKAAAILGGNVRREFISATIDIDDGVQNDINYKCTAFLVDRDDEVVILEQGKALNYCNSSLTYSGPIRIMKESVYIPVKSSEDLFIPNKFLSITSNNRIYVDKAQVLSIGDYIKTGSTYSEIIGINNTEVTTKSGVNIDEDAYGVLGVKRLWEELRRALPTFPLIVFPKTFDANTLNNLRIYKNQIDVFVGSLLTALLKSKLSRWQSEYYGDMTNFLRRSHLAMRKNRALDILFAGDVELYYSLDEYTSNYELLLKKSIDDMRAKIT